MAMKKRYYPSARSRDVGGQSSESYAGIDNRIRQEARDGSMISEDHSAIANLPQQVVYKHYPKVNGYADFDLDDTINGVDRLMEMENRKKLRHPGLRKY